MQFEDNSQNVPKILFLLITVCKSKFNEMKIAN